ncbi:MAG TPA: hypothetical protein VKX49_22690 [Bryobacteraceae bacterium]|nr:hypothetical protein [Bryobacteraceae bacterium]
MRSAALAEIRDSKQITQAQAAERMQVNTRWVRKPLARKRRDADRVVIHCLRGRGSNRRLAKA